MKQEGAIELKIHRTDCLILRSAFGFF